MRLRTLLLSLAVALVALAAAPRISAQQPGVARLSANVLDVVPPSARVRGVPGVMVVANRACRIMPTADTRRRVVDIAVQEWAFFGFRTADATETDDGPSTAPGAGDALRDETSRDAFRRGRGRLSPGEASRVASSIGGYWAVTPEGSWIVARQNDRWNGEDGIAARWNAPWSAAFISWVMCEAGLGAAAQFQRAIAHHAYIDQAIRARDGRAPEAAFAAYDAGETTIAPGDLLCSSRRPAYRTLAERRRQMGVGARSHCDIVVTVDEVRGRILAIGGNVRGVVSLKLLPAFGEAGRPLRAGTGDDDRPMFAHLKLRAAPIDAHALGMSPTIKASGCPVVSGTRVSLC